MTALVDALRPAIADTRVLDAIAAVPRDRFAPGARAWENAAVAIGHGQTISQPLVVARMCELLALRGDERVLDVGAGSGYHAAVLAQLAREVWAVERVPELARRAAAVLTEVAPGVRVVTGDGTAGLPEHGPYDAINVAAAGTREQLAPLRAVLAPGGRIVAPLDGRLTVITAGGETAHDPVRFVPLT